MSVLFSVLVLLQVTVEQVPVRFLVPIAVKTIIPVKFRVYFLDLCFLFSIKVLVQVSVLLSVEILVQEPVQTSVVPVASSSCSLGFKLGCNLVFNSISSFGFSSDSPASSVC